MTLMSPTVNPKTTSIDNMFVSGTVKERTSCANSPIIFDDLNDYGYDDSINKSGDSTTTVADVATIVKPQGCCKPLPVQEIRLLFALLCV